MSDNTPSMTGERRDWIDFSDLREMRHSGIIDSVVDDTDFGLFIDLAREAVELADRNHKTYYVVRSRQRLYVEFVPPEHTTDIDAVYVLKVPPGDLRARRCTLLLARRKTDGK